MTAIEKKIKNLIQTETKKAYEKRKNLKKVEIVYEENNKGQFLTKLKAYTRKKVIHLSSEGSGAEKSIKRVFINLRKILLKDKKKKFKRVFDIRKELA